MGVITRFVIAGSATLVFAGTATAEDATFSAVEETAIAGPEAAAVLLSTRDDEAVVGPRAAIVLIAASQPVETPTRKSALKPAKLRRHAREAGGKAVLSSR